MHEYSIAQALLARIRREAAQRGARSVHRVQVSIGALSGVEADLLATAFALCREGTVCDGAALDIERVPARWICPRCGAGVASGDALRCVTCALPAQLARGDEIFLDRIEMEVP